MGTQKDGNGVFVQRTMIDVGVPSGKYSDARPVNIGNHFVVVDPTMPSLTNGERWSSAHDSTISSQFVGIG
jgi:hypothetical protein